jgi:tetratricopeptide (TPR) repeat protein
MALPSKWRPYLLTAALVLLPNRNRIFAQDSPASDAAALIAQGKQAESAGRLQEAMGDYAAARKVDARNAQASLRMGILFGRSGDFTAAASAFRQAIAIDPGLAEAHYNLGLACLGKSKNPDWSGALPEFKTAVQLRSNYPEALNMVGVGLLETGQPALALPQFQSALLLTPNSAELHFNLGRALEATGNNDHAYTEYLSAVQLRPAYPEADRAIADILFQRKDYTSAASHLREALAANPDSQDAHFLLGKVLRAQHKNADAQVEFKLASQAEQRQSDIIQSTHLSNQSLELAKQGDFTDAVATARQAIQLQPDNGIAHYNLGLLLADSGDLPAAIAEVRKAISLSPLRPALYLGLARMNEKANDRNGAIDSLQHALLLDPADRRLAARLNELVAAPAAGNRASATGQKQPFPYGAPQDTATDHFAAATDLSRQSDLQGAIGELLHALTLDPARADIRYNLAVAYTQVGQYENAELEFRKVLNVDANSVQAHMALGTVLLQNKDLSNAAAEFRRVLVLQPDNKQAPQLLSQCQTHQPASLPQ